MVRLDGIAPAHRACAEFKGWAFTECEEAHPSKPDHIPPP
jgi:hypothetical protein